MTRGVVWLRGRIQAGLGRSREAQVLLAQARQGFDQRNMSWDVALALLEEAVLLLEEGRAAEVKVLAKELTTVFESKGVHREALAALRLFKEAAEHEAATAELARRVLGYLFRARHDEGLRFEAGGAEGLR
jgi:prolyl-tRNA synthetase